MTDEEKQAMVKSLAAVPDGDAALLPAYLQLAESAILELRNPLSRDPSSEPWESRYDVLQCEMAAEMYARRGAEGEVSHSENGLTRTYAAAVLSPQLVRRVIPKGRAI